MKIILTQEVRNLGQIGDIVSVKNGYARNFLIPNKKAIACNKNNENLIQSQKQELISKRDNFNQKLNIITSFLFDKYISIISNASDDGRLYGSIKKPDIANKIQDLLTGELKNSIKIDKKNIILENPIKETGIYNITIDFQCEETPVVKLVVAKTQEEIKSLINKNKKPAKTEEDNNISQEQLQN